jgi:CubicO group peptidase (beta-lactamase class C family)
MRGWGVGDRESGVPAADTTSFRLGSVTKQFTAVLVLRLVDQQRITLDDSIGRYVQGLPKPWGPVTIRQLMNHTSGIPDVQNDEWRRHWADNVSPRESFTRSTRADMRFPSGTRAEYSNTNYKLLGLLIEAVLRTSFESALQRDLAEPFGLKRTRYCEDAAGANGQAIGYVVTNRAAKRASYLNISQPFASGGVCSTAGDMARWNIALHTGQILSRASYQLMVTPQGAASALRYGFGLFVEPSLAGTPAFVHNGGIPGFQASNAWLPADSLSVTVLANAEPVSTLDLVMRDLAEIALGRPVPLGAPRSDVDALRRYVGEYVVQIPGRPLTIRVRLEGRTLVAQPDGQAPLPLRAVGEDAFDSPANMSVRFRFTMVNNVVVKASLEQRGRIFDMLKAR